jgi:transposase-like protein
MESVPRGSDGRRLFSPEFKREQVARLARGEVTISELSRELGISRSLLQRRKHLISPRAARPWSRPTRTWCRRANCGRRSRRSASSSV